MHCSPICTDMCLTSSSKNFRSHNLRHNVWHGGGTAGRRSESMGPYINNVTLRWWFVHTLSSKIYTVIAVDSSIFTFPIGWTQRDSVQSNHLPPNLTPWPQDKPSNKLNRYGGFLDGGKHGVEVSLGILWWQKIMDVYFQLIDPDGETQVSIYFMYIHIICIK